MSSRHVRVILLSGIVLIAMVIGIGLILSYRLDKTTFTTLPDTQPSTSAGSETPGAGAANNNGQLNVNVSAENVQAVIATLLRYESYTRHILIESFYSTGNASYDIDATVSGSDTAMKIVGPGGGKYIVLAGGKLYVWYEGDTDYRVGPADALGDERDLTDEFQMILTYEDVTILDESSILDAGFVNYGDENCIYVKYITDDVFRYTTICYISVASGLLTGAEQYDGSVLVYRMTSSDLQQVTDNDAFSLPDGNNALSVP